MDSAAAGGIEICASSMQYIDFSITNSDCRGRIGYINIESSFKWYVGAHATTTPNMKVTPSGLSVSGAEVSGVKKLMFNENP